MEIILDFLRNEAYVCTQFIKGEGRRNSRYVLKEEAFVWFT